MKVTLAFDSFKGSLSSQEVAEAFESGLRSCAPECEVVKVVIADGGEGTTEALVEALHGEYIDAVVSDPLGRPITTRYGIVDNGSTAIIEMAKASGLPLLHPCERNPLQTSTYGTGEMIADALKRGCRHFLIGIGGSATNDGGMGMLSALGYQFLDKQGNRLKGNGASLLDVASIDDSQILPAVREAHFTVACDVTNPLYGENGAAHVFARQKGADTHMVEQLDRGLRNYAQVIKEYNDSDIAALPGAGAAGGLGAGFCALLNAHLVPGIEMILDAIKFDRIIADSSLIVTGEGCIDYQTLMGKTPSGVLKRASQHNIPVVAIGGKVVWCDALRDSNFAAILPITYDDIPIEEAMKPHIAQENVKKTAIYIANKYLLGE